MSTETGIVARRRAIVLNDCSRPAHWGTQLVQQGLALLAREAGIELTRSYPLGYSRWDAAYVETVRQADIVLINGEGTCHHDAHAALALIGGASKAKEAGRPVVLLNSVWEGNRRLNELLRFVDLIFVRESRSADEILGLGRTATVVGDLSLAVPPIVPGQGTGDRALVTDSVSDEPALRLASFACRHELSFRPMRRWLGGILARHPIRAADPLWRPRTGFRPLGPLDAPVIARASMIITGRYHGACLAITYGRPFIAFASNSHKMVGLLEDLGHAQGSVALDALDWPMEEIRSQMTVEPSSARTYLQCARIAQRGMIRAIGSL